MYKPSAFVLLAWLSITSLASAADIQGIVKKLDLANQRISLVVGDRSKSYSLSPNVKVQNGQQPNNKQAGGKPAAGLASIKIGIGVTIHTEAQNGKQVVTSILVQPTLKRTASTLRRPRVGVRHSRRHARRRSSRGTIVVRQTQKQGSGKKKSPSTSQPKITAKKPPATSKPRAARPKPPKAASPSRPRRPAAPKAKSKK